MENSLNISFFTDEKPRYRPLQSNDASTSPDATEIPDDLVWRRRFFALLVLSTPVMALLLGAVAYGVNSNSCSSSTPGATTPYSPAPLKYVNRYLTGDPDTPKFMGKPRPELDEAWHELLAGTLIRYSEHELSLANNATSVGHKESGYVGGLGISHSLHCLKRIKQYVHPEYYYSHEDQDWSELYSHVDHCLESIRQELMCNADVNVYTLKWTRHSRFKPTVKVPQPHACVDWKGLHGWMIGRAAKLDDMIGPPEGMFDEEDTAMTSV